MASARSAAATLGALCAELRNDELAVIAFWSDASLLVPLGAPAEPLHVVEEMLRLPSRGLTNLAFPLEVAGHQLAQSRSRERRVVLLSDCVHNAGPDPRTVAVRLPRLDVVLDRSGEHDTDLARDLALLGRGRVGAPTSHRDVGATLSRIFAS